MKFKWTKRQIEYLLRPLPKVERTYDFEVIVLMIVIVVSIIVGKCI